MAAGVVAFACPGVTALALLYLIAAWAILTGIVEIIAAVRLRHVISEEWLMGLAGLLSILLGVVLIVAPGAGALAVVFGIVLIVLGLRPRGLREGGADRASVPHIGAIGSGGDHISRGA
jgi:uncharacterized membrane protein HdeD (DUF308 family)